MQGLAFTVPSGISVARFCMGKVGGMGHMALPRQRTVLAH
jgi:hypothetical protein